LKRSGFNVTKAQGAAKAPVAENIEVSGGQKTDDSPAAGLKSGRFDHKKN
jgi:hypothetical protein